MDTNRKARPRQMSLWDPIESSTLRAARMATSAQDAYSAWISEYSWAHKVDLTFRYQAGQNTAEREFKAFIRRLEQHVRQVVPFFASIESGKAGGRTHIHGVLANTESATAESIERMWEAGRSVSAVYDAHRGAIRYAAKDLVRTDAILLLRLPRVRKAFGQENGRDRMT